MSFRSFANIGWLIAALVLTTNTFALSPVQTGPGGVILPAHSSRIGYLQATSNTTSIIVPDLKKWFEVGDVLPLLQKNQRFYVGLYEAEDGYARVYAIPRLNEKGEGTAWVTQEKEVVIASQVKSQTGRFFLRPSEFLPIVNHEAGFFTATCERYGRLFQLRLPVDQPGLFRLDKLPENIRYLVNLKQQRFQVVTSGESMDDELDLAIEEPREILSKSRNPHEKTVITNSDFVDPYPQPVLRRSHPQLAPHKKVVQKPAPLTETERQISELDELSLVPEPPKKKRIRRHVINASNLDTMAVDFSEPNDVDTGDHDVAQTDAVTPTSDANPVSVPTNQAEPSLAGTAIAPATEPTQTVATTTPAPPPTQVVATPPAATPEPTQTVAASEPANPKASASTEPLPPPETQALSDDTIPADPKVAPAVENHLASTTSPTEASPAAEDVAATPLQTSEISGAPQSDNSSKVATVATTVLIVIALLSSGFVILVVVLALMFNRGRRKRKPSKSKTKTSDTKKPFGFGRRKEEAPVPVPPAIISNKPDIVPDMSMLNNQDELDPDAEHENGEDDDDGDSGTFTGSLESFSVAELIQFLNSSKETGVLVIATALDNTTSKLYFERGEIIDALSARNAGEAAANDILSLREGLFSFNRQHEISAVRTIKTSTMSLLLETSPIQAEPHESQLHQKITS